jgi:hypothetical protein
MIKENGEFAAWKEWQTPPVRIDARRHPGENHFTAFVIML